MLDERIKAYIENPYEVERMTAKNNDEHTYRCPSDCEYANACQSSCKEFCEVSAKAQRQIDRILKR